jgi:hypothetical protein
MAKKLDDLMAALPAKRRATIDRRARELAALQDTRRAAERTQADLAAGRTSPPVSSRGVG